MPAVTYISSQESQTEIWQLMFKENHCVILMLCVSHSVVLRILLTVLPEPLSECVDIALFLLQCNREMKRHGNGTHHNSNDYRRFPPGCRQSPDALAYDRCQRVPALAWHRHIHTPSGLPGPWSCMWQGQHRQILHIHRRSIGSGRDGAYDTALPLQYNRRTGNPYFAWNCRNRNPYLSKRRAVRVDIKQIQPVKERDLPKHLPAQSAIISQ